VIKAIQSLVEGHFPSGFSQDAMRTMRAELAHAIWTRGHVLVPS
jgi:hypothetical protein